MERDQEAAAMYDCALVIEPENAHAWCNLADALLALDRPQDALEILDSLDEREGLRALILRSRVLAALDRDEEAVAAARGATELDPDSAEAWRTLSTTANVHRELDSAFAAAIRATELEPEDGVSWMVLGNALYNLGRGDEAADASAAPRSWIPKKSRSGRTSATRWICATGFRRRRWRTTARSRSTLRTTWPGVG
jgi:protein O-GlcNAc transferase